MSDVWDELAKNLGIWKPNTRTARRVGGILKFDPDQARAEDGKWTSGGGGGGPSGASSEGGSSGGATARAPDPTADADGDGVTDASRVGAAGKDVPPPPPINRLPNLNDKERSAESRFASAYEKDPDGMAKEYRARLAQGEIGDGPNVFATDDAKLLSPDYNPSGSDDEVKEARALYNAAVHQTANAMAKRAFIQHLEENAGGENKTILVTAGGVAAGKGFALNSIEESNSLSKKVTAVWDTAGEQNSTELPWVQQEADRLGYKVTYAYVDADPDETWANPKRGVIERAAKKGRMVDAKLFAESYELGAKNFKAFAEKNKSKANFLYIENRGTPKLLDGFPSKALGVKSGDLYARATSALKRSSAPSHVKAGGTVNERYWP